MKGKMHQFVIRSHEKLLEIYWFSDLFGYEFSHFKNGCDVVAAPQRFDHVLCTGADRPIFQ